MRYSSCIVLIRLLPIACIVASVALLGCASLFRDEAQALELEKQWNARTKSDPQTLIWLRSHSEWDMKDYDVKRKEVREALCLEVRTLRMRLKREAYTFSRYDEIVQSGEPLFTALLLEAKEGAQDELPADILEFCQDPYLNKTAITEAALVDALSSTAQAVCAATTLQELEAAIRTKSELIREAYSSTPNSVSIKTIPFSTLATFAAGVDKPAAEAAIIRTRTLSPELRKPFLERSMNYQALRAISNDMYEKEEIRNLVDKRLTNPQTRVTFALHATTERGAEQILRDRFYGDEGPLPDQVLAQFVVQAPKEWTTAKNRFLKQFLDDNEKLQEIDTSDSPLRLIFMQPDLSWVSDNNKSRICHFLSSYSSRNSFAPTFIEICHDMNFLLECFVRSSKSGSWARSSSVYPLLPARLLVAAQRGEVELSEGQRKSIKIALKNAISNRNADLNEFVLREVTDEEILAEAFNWTNNRNQVILAQSPERRRFLLSIYLAQAESWQRNTTISRVEGLIDTDPTCITEINAVLTPTFFAHGDVQSWLRNIPKWDTHSETFRQWALDWLIAVNKDEHASAETVGFLLDFEANEEMPQSLRARVTPFLKEARAMAQQRLQAPPEGVLSFGGFYIGMPALDARLLAPKGVKFSWKDDRITAIGWDANARFKTFNEWEDDEFIDAFPKAYGLPEFEYKSKDDEMIAKLNTIMSNSLGAAMVDDMMMDPAFSARFEQERAELYRPFHQIKSRKYKLRFRLKQDGSFQVSELE